MPAPVTADALRDHAAPDNGLPEDIREHMH